MRWAGSPTGAARPLLARCAPSRRCLLAVALPFIAARPAGYTGTLCLLGGLVGSLYTLAVVEAGRSGEAGNVMATVAGISVTYTLGSVLGPLLGGAATSASLAWGLPWLIALVSAAALLALRLGPRLTAAAVSPRGPRCRTCPASAPASIASAGWSSTISARRGAPGRGPR